MSEEQRVTKVVQTYDQPIEISLTRGAKNQYRWSLTVKAEDMYSALRLIEEMDRELQAKFSASQPAPNSREKEDAPHG